MVIADELAGDYILTSERGMRRSGTLNAKKSGNWSSNTKAEYLEHELNEIVAKIRELE